MDDEAAEIELLEQNLNKTRQISQRMISILTNFDNRLVKLEKSILPLHTSTQLLNRRAANIDSTLQLIDEVSSNREGLAAEEALILRGPQSTQLSIYTDALERMNASIAFKGSGSDSQDTARLVEAGARKLTQLYTALVAEASSGAPPAGVALPDRPDVNSNLVPFPPSLIDSLIPLVSFLRTLPLPATHPSHPAAAAIQAAFTDAQRGYADMRGAWARRCLEPYARRAVERSETLDVVSAARELGRWAEAVMAAAESEFMMISEFTLLPGQTQLQSTFTTLLTPILTVFSTSLTQFTSVVKRALQKRAFLALSVYAELSAPYISTRWDDVIQRRSGASAGRVGSGKDNALKDGLHGLRALCLRSFPEFLADVKMASVPRGAGELGTGIAEVTETVVRYLQDIPAVQDAVASALLTLGDGNWKMGEGMQVSKGPKLGEGDEALVVEHYLFDVVTTLMSTLTTLSRSARRPALGAIFLLNNVSHITTELLFNPSTPIDMLLPPPVRDILQSNFRTAKAGYFDANFSPLVQALSDGGPGSSAAKAATKEKFTRFFDLLDEIAERHRFAKVLPDDSKNRDIVADEAVKLVVPSLQRFIQRNGGKDFSKNPQKYIKMSPEEVENTIRGFY